MTVLGQDRFRMKLDTFDGKLAMAHAHDLAVFAARGHIQAGSHGPSHAAGGHGPSQTSGGGKHIASGSGGSHGSN